MSTARLDLVILALPGVQRLIGEARSTADLRSGSEIVAELARVAATAAGAGLVMPHEVGVAAVPNRVVLLAPAGTGPAVGRSVTRAVRDRWTAILREVLG